MSLEQENSKSLDTKNEPLQNSCAICLDQVKQPLATFCGHIFCKYCILKWLDANTNNKICPVCNSKISKDKLIRLFGINDIETTDDQLSTSTPAKNNNNDNNNSNNINQNNGHRNTRNQQINNNDQVIFTNTF